MASDHPLMKNSEAARLLSRPWWNLCFVHGDQTKYYRQLYGKRRPIRTLMQHSDDNNDSDVQQQPQWRMSGEEINTAILARRNLELN